MAARAFAHGQETAHQGGAGRRRSCGARRAATTGRPRLSSAISARGSPSNWRGFVNYMRLRRPSVRDDEHILFRGNPVAVRVVCSQTWRAPNKVAIEHDAITVTCKPGSKTAPARSLENWLRKQARERIEQHIADISKRLKRAPNRIYVMGQRTKWGNCSALGNLSFNWRLVMAPDFVLRYIVTHEMVHLAVPDHSRKFWLTVQSLCPETERARQWLVANGQRIQLMQPGAANG